MTQREEIRPSQVRIPSPVPPPPPSCWGENRARFSDVVARNPESVSPAFSTSGKTAKSHEISHELWTNPNRRIVTSEGTERLTIQETCSSPIEYTEPVPSNVTPAHFSGMAIEQDNVYDADSSVIQAQQQSNSYFINTFNEPPVSFPRTP